MPLVPPDFNAMPYDPVALAQTFCFARPPDYFADCATTEEALQKRANWVEGGLYQGMRSANRLNLKDLTDDELRDIFLIHYEPWWQAEAARLGANPPRPPKKPKTVDSLLSSVQPPMDDTAMVDVPALTAHASSATPVWRRGKLPENPTRDMLPFYSNVLQVDNGTAQLGSLVTPRDRKTAILDFREKYAGKMGKLKHLDAIEMETTRQAKKERWTYGSRGLTWLQLFPIVSKIYTERCDNIKDDKADLRAHNAAASVPTVATATLIAAGPVTSTTITGPAGASDAMDTSDSAHQSDYDDHAASYAFDFMQFEGGMYQQDPMVDCI